MTVNPAQLNLPTVHECCLNHCRAFALDFTTLSSSSLFRCAQVVPAGITGATDDLWTIRRVDAIGRHVRYRSHNTFAPQICDL